MKTNLNDVTFLLIVRVDSLVRLENLLAVVRFLHKHFECPITVWEIAAYPNGIVRKLLKGIDYRFVPDEDTVLYRTHYLNCMAADVQTPFLCVWDVDVIVPPGQVMQAVEQLRSGTYDVALPYDGKALDTSRPIRDLFIQNSRLDLLYKQQAKMQPLHGGLSLRGGAFFVTTEAYRKAGRENTAFYGWGSEDFDRYDRWKTLGHHIAIVPGVLFHLTHPRGENSTYHTTSRAANSEHALFTTRVSSADELKQRHGLK